MNALNVQGFSGAQTRAPEAPPLVSARGIVKTFGHGEAQVQALKSVSLDLGAGEFCALCGPSGSGKSTLLNVLGCLDLPDKGEISFDQQIIDLKSETQIRNLRRDAFGFVFQNFNLVPTLSAVENVEMALFHSRMNRRATRAQASEMLALVGLGDRQKHRPSEMSGGQQQRVAVARALVRHPRMVFADEPTANLDAKNAFELTDLMDELRAKTGTSFIVSTHDARLMDRFTRIVTLEDGRIVS